MKNFRLQAIALFLCSSSLVLTSCSNDDDGSSTQPVSKTAFVTAVTGPETGGVNQDLTYEVSFTVDSKCGAFDKVVETTQGNVKNIEVKAKYEGKDCGTTPATKSFMYKFKSATAGTYLLNFKKSTSEVITKTVVVN